VTAERVPRLVAKWITRLTLWPIAPMLAIGYGLHLALQNDLRVADRESASLAGRDKARDARFRAEMAKIPVLDLRLAPAPAIRTSHGGGIALALQSTAPDLRALVVGGTWNPCVLLRSADSTRGGTRNNYTGLGPDLAREGSTVVQIDDDRVLVSGGHDLTKPREAARAVHSVWQVGPFHPDRTIPMTVPRAYHAAFAVTPHDVIVLGGESALVPTDTVERVDPTTGVSRLSTPLSEARSRFASLRLADGRLLLTGGLGKGGFAAPPLASAEFHDPLREATTAAPPMATGRHSHGMLLLHDGAVMVAGGLRFDARQGAADVLDAVEILRDGGWKTTQPMNFPRYLPVLARLADGRVLAMGGGNPYVEIWDPELDRWDIVGHARRSVFAGLPFGATEIVLASPGSMTAYLNPYATLESRDYGAHSLVEPHDITAGRVVPTGYLSIGRREATATELADGRILVTGGHFAPPHPGDRVPGFTVLGHTELFDPKTERSVSTGQLRHRRFRHQAFTLPDGRVAIAGGLAFETPEAARAVLPVEVVDPKTMQSTVSASTVAGITRGVLAHQLPDGDLALAQASDGSGVQVLRWHWRDGTLEPLAMLTSLGRVHAFVKLSDALVLVLGTRGDGPAVDSALVWNIATGRTRLLPAPPVAVTPKLVVDAADTGRVGLIGREGVVTFDFVEGTWTNRSDFFRSLAEEPDAFVSTIRAHVGGGRLWMNNILPPARKRDPAEVLEGFVDLFTDEPLSRTPWDIPRSTTGTPLMHSDGRLYFVGSEAQRERENPEVDRHAGVESFVPPAQGVSPLRWIRGWRAARAIGKFE
jgi:hypothetical protein